MKDSWEVLFCAGNGSGKTHIFYWNIVMYAIGIHPHQFAKTPLKIKILVNDFEHGYGKIFKETVLEPHHMPERFEIWSESKNKDKPIKFFTEEHRAETELERLLEKYPDAEIRQQPESTIGPMLHENYIAKLPSRDDRTLKLKGISNSLIFFQTSEQKKKLHSGTNFDILGCDEEPEYQVYDESKRGLRTAKGGGRILHAFTPPFDEEVKHKGPSWTKFKLIDPFEKGEDNDIHVVRAAMADNPSITDAYIRRFSKGKTEQQLRIQLYGDYPTWGEMVHPDFQDFLWDPKKRLGHLLPYDFEVPFDDPDVKFEMAIDWHASKPAAIVWTFEYTAGPNKGDVVVWDELSPPAGKGLTITQTATAMKEVEGYRFDSGRRRIVRYGDPKMRDKNHALISGFNPWDEFRNNGVRLTEGWNRNPDVGISTVNDFFRGKSESHKDHPRLYIKENCKTTRHNFKNHYWVRRKDGTGDPDPKFSDYCVSVRYILQRKSRKIKKGMIRDNNKWPLNSYEGNSTFGPWGGDYVQDYSAYIDPSAYSRR